MEDTLNSTGLSTDNELTQVDTDGVQAEQPTSEAAQETSPEGDNQKAEPVPSDTEGQAS